MRLLKRMTAVALTASLVMSMTACSSTNSTEESVSSTSSAITTSASEALSDYTQNSDALTFDNSAWNYDSDNDVYWQINVGYCSDPETTDYETLGIYVPGAYMTATDNGDGTYTCEVNAEGSVGDYTASTAPIVFPVNTAGYSAQAAPTSYSYDSISEYLESGLIYVYAGMRGRSNGYDENDELIYSGGAPWGVTDLKAAVRYYRFNESSLPGSTDNIFTFGHSGGGAQSALMGATGDSELYYDYLTSIGAAMFDADGNYISDAISGAMCWCPITSLDYADEAYEWNMGQYSDDGTRSDTTWTSALSDDLAAAYAEYINALGLTDSDGNTLTLEETEDGIYTAGSYYDYIKSVIETSLNNFLTDTSFPYTESAGTTMGDGGFGGSGDDSSGGENVPAGGMETTDDSTSTDSTTGDMPSGDLPDGEAPSGDMADGGMPSGEAPSGDMAGGMPGGESSDSSDSSEGTTYETAQDYIDSLNSDETWITYDEATNTASITSVEAFVNHCKSASKDVAAFDALDESQAENMLFGNDDSDTSHFDSVIASLLADNSEVYSQYSDYEDTYAAAYEEALSTLDKLGSSIETRMNMYNPMYYLSDYYAGYETSTVATHWRIRTGIEQGDTALTVETNLALALESYDSVEDVDFETVWGQGHTTAERTGDSATNFIEWVNECVNS